MLDCNIAELLKQKDKQNYFATLLLDKKHRLAVQSLYLFNAEISAISHLVKEPQAGEIRLTYWRDILQDKQHNHVEKNPVASALLQVLKDYQLPTLPLIRLIEARRFDLYNDRMPDITSFEGYAGETTSIIYQYGSMILNSGKELKTGNAAGHLGVAQALIGHIEAFDYNRLRQRLFLPQSYFSQAGLEDAEIFSKEKPKQMRAAITKLIDLASSHLEKAKNEIENIPKHIRPIFAPIVILNRQLRVLKRSKTKPIQSISNMPDWQKIYLMVIWTLRN